MPTGPITITPHASWKNRLDLTMSEPFANFSANLRWVKFTVLMRDPSKVYFQDSRPNAYPLHAPFAIERLNPFFGMTVEQYEAVSLHAAGQEAITGAVLISNFSNEIGIQLVRLDPYAKEMVKIVFDLVRSSIDGPMGLATFYMPTFEQQVNEPTRAWFESHAVPVSDPARWTDGSVCYATGWSLGKLVHVAPTQIDAAYADGRLTVNDVLLTEQVPAEVPPVAGVVTLAPSTPNSHVAILATTLGIPFVYTPHAEDVARLTSLEGKQVLLRASTPYNGLCKFDVFDASNLSASVRAELLAEKVIPTLNLPPKQPRGAYFASTDALTAADTRFFGGKASNYGLLRRVLPNDSYPAVALSFDVWDDAMAQQVSTGRTLRAEIDSRLAPISTWPPANLAVTKQTLLGIRTLIENEATLSNAAQTGVRSALTSFDAQKGIRFRSSTNVEDTDQFTGAGLYDSYTGCLADDDDADTVGPSRCNANKPDERGVFLALRKVFASFYNDNAYLERLRHGVNESQVGMAVLVHLSVPDDDELANGVATLTYRGATSRDLKLVTQAGSESVTNPTGTATPELVSGFAFSGQWYFDLMNGSSRVPLGSWVMNEQTDYGALGGLLDRVAAQWATTVAPPFTLDFEFKKQVPLPGKLWVKQVRPLAIPSSAATVVPFVLNRGQKLCVLQGENSDVIALHRLRLRFDPALRDVRLTDSERATSLFASATLEQFDGDALTTLTGAPATWTGFVHTQNMDTLTDAFSFGSGATARTVAFAVEVPRLVRGDLPPIITSSDLRFSVHTTWAQPQPIIEQYPGAPTTATEEYASLVSCPEDEVITGGHSRQTRTMTGSGISVTATFYWPPAPQGATAGYTAPNVKWVGTEITGLTSTPLQLTADFAQTYRPQHHNFNEDFLFDPFRDPATTAAQKAELMTRDVKWLIVTRNSEFRAMGFNGQLRTLP
ncbi:MAG: PEP/pyruvate-binding domain-containing protein [Archangium sp.]